MLFSLRFDIYLPLYYNNKQPIEKSNFVDVFNELSNLFGGCSSEENSLMGSWIDPKSNIRYDDENRVYHIICDKTLDNIQIISNYKEKIKYLFQQEEIMIYYIHIYRF